MNGYNKTQCPLHLNTHTVIECSFRFRFPHLHMKLKWLLNHSHAIEECWQDSHHRSSGSVFASLYFSAQCRFHFKTRKSTNTYQMVYECNENGTPKRIRTRTQRSSYVIYMYMSILSAAAKIEPKTISTRHTNKTASKASEVLHTLMCDMHHTNTSAARTLCFFLSTFKKCAFPRAAEKSERYKICVVEQ